MCVYVITVTHRQPRLSCVQSLILPVQAIQSCVVATVRRDREEPSKPPSRTREERVMFRWRHFLLLTYLEVTASTAQLCLMTQDEIREGEVAGSTRETREPSPDCRSGKKAKRRRELQQENLISQTLTSATVIGELEPSLEATTERRLDYESVGLSACDRIKSVSGECSSGMDDVFVLRSSLESHDRPG